MLNTRLLLLAAVLGLTAAQSERISFAVGGETSDIDDHPWLVQLEFREHPGGPWDSMNTCTGAILNEKQVLTAAHCLGLSNVLTARDLRVRAGATARMEGGQTVQAARIIRHPRYNFLFKHYDMAIINLAEKLELGGSAQALKLAPADKMPKEGDTVMGGGWGTTVETENKLPDELITFKMTVAPERDCERKVHGSFFCTVPETGSPCFGDSGSPTWVPAKDGEPAMLVGVLHGGFSCQLDSLNVYSDIHDDHNRAFLKRHVTSDV